MTKLSRREYLKQMGASAAVVTGMAAGVVGEPQRRANRRRPTTPSPGRHGVKEAISTNRASGYLQFPDWPATSLEPRRDAPVTLIFGGLMGFFYNGACDIGFHPGDHHHPMMRIWDKTGTTCSLRPEISPLPDRCKRMIVEINRPNAAVNFFERYPEVPFNDRIDGDPMDFRWLPDLHSADFYPNSNFPIQKKFNRLLKVRHGTFYTRIISKSTFYRVNIDNEGDDKIAMGHMPLYMAAAIVPAAGETVSLSLQELLSNKFVEYDRIPLTPAPGKQTEVQFFNHCLESQGCKKFDPSSANDGNRNDFHFVREVVNPSTRPKYGLKIATRDDDDPVLDFCVSESKQDIHTRDQNREKLRVISDPSPCMGAGYGGGGGGGCCS